MLNPQAQTFQNYLSLRVPVFRLPPRSKFLFMLLPLKLLNRFAAASAQRFHFIQREDAQYQFSCNHFFRNASDCRTA